MKQVMAKIGSNIPVYRRTDTVVLQSSQSLDAAKNDPNVRHITFRVCNQHDPEAPLPILASVLICVMKVAFSRELKV